jgi:hypothetical protein
MAGTKSNDSRVAYIYKESSPTPGNGTWHPIVGIASTNSNYTWKGTHAFEDYSVTFEEVVKAQGGVNNFSDETARDAAIPTPDHGTVAFVRSVNGVNTANQIQFYSAATSKWINYSDTSFVSKTSDYTIALADSGKTLTVNSGSAVAITIPANATVPFPVGTRIDVVALGSGAVSFTAAVGVNLSSKNSWLKLNGQYAGGTLIKIDATNAWLLVGDLKS